MELLARYPNKTKLVDSKNPDKDGNSYLLCYQNGNLVSEEKFSGVVYINETTFEVYKYPNKTGLFTFGVGLNWNVETPRQKYNKAQERFLEEIVLKTASLDDKCYCQYPRIIDYISNKNSIDSTILQSKLQHTFLTIKKPTNTELCDVQTLKCNVCKSEFEWEYKERQIDKITIKISKATSIIGKEVLEIVPNYLTAYFDAVFCRKSYLKRSNLKRATLKETIDYLFEE